MMEAMRVATSIPSPDPVLAQFQLGPLTIHTYAICILIGIVAAVIITQRRLSRRGAESGVVLDIILWAVPLGIIGARFYHVFTHVGDYFYPKANLWNIFAIWDGGNALYGSLLGGAVGAYIGCRMAGIRFWTFADALAPAMLVAQSLGRFGNWFNHELFGLPTTLPWGLQIESTNPKFPHDLPAGTLFHPLFLYEIIWNLIGVVLILLIERRFRLQWGRVFALYLIWYGLGRSWLEAIRIDPTSDGFAGIPANIWASFIAIALGIVLFVVQTRRHPELEPSPYAEGRGPRAPKAVVEDADGTVDPSIESETAGNTR
jgi:prolipoprotein diacylglyceryl transferase